MVEENQPIIMLPDHNQEDYMVQEGVEGELVNPVHTGSVNSFIGSGKQTLKSLIFNSTLWL
jgi:hypothetical protein